MIIWDEEKNVKLKLQRGISFEDVSDIILSDNIVDIVQHPKRKNQSIFILELNEYIHAVPFVLDKDENIVLKTVFPSRKFHAKYGGEI